ncbi:MAG: tandem-95 repeat protein, partial [Verrucomicrobia bacterium]|nr:tandem-95 repeat protein [Verrucomicrobiota bacterium]
MRRRLTTSLSAASWTRPRSLARLASGAFKARLGWLLVWVWLAPLEGPAQQGFIPTATGAALALEVGACGGGMATAGPYTVTDTIAQPIVGEAAIEHVNGTLAAGYGFWHALQSPPVALDDAYTVSEGGTLAPGTAHGVLANDTDADYDPFTAVLVDLPRHGTLTLSPDGSFTYVHDGSETTSDTLTYQAYDGAAESEVATVSVTIIPVNDAPALTVPPDQTLPELSTLAVAASATDADLPANTLTFSLLNAPAGVIIDANSGAIAWTPTEAQGPGNYTITVEVTDNGDPNLSDNKSFTVTVNEVNTAPVLTVPADQTLPELSTLAVAASATDADLPANTLTFSLLNAPSGVSIDANSGAIAWTPTEAQGPGNYTITVKVTDDGNPSLFDTKSFTVTVNEVNTAPVLTPIANQRAFEGRLLTFTAAATDADTPPNTLTFSLDPGAPAGAQITGVGVFTWTPTSSQAPGSYTVTVRVTDNGVPAASDEQTVSIAVMAGNSVVCSMPAEYVPLVEFLVVDLATPRVGVRSYRVEDRVPKGWTVSNISHGGAFNASSRWVSWGPFRDDLIRELTYRVTPPANARGPASFDGRGHFDNQVVPITGQRTTTTVNRPPIARDDEVWRSSNGALVIPAADILAN